MNIVQPIRDKEKVEEMKKCLREKNIRDYLLFMFGINTGLRISDILPLKVKDVKGTHVIIKEEKTDKIKRQKINNALRMALDEYVADKKLNDDDYLFPSRKGDSHITRKQAYRVLNGCAKCIGLEEIGTHTLRKTYGYHFYQKTKDVAMLQKLFNHSAPSITLAYIGITQDMMDEAMDSFEL